MTGYADERKAIESRLQAAWTATPIRFENVPFVETDQPYVALFILDGEGQQISAGTVALRRWPGLIIVQVFERPDSGTQGIRTWADSLAAIFDRQQFSSGNSGLIRCRIPSIVPIGIREGWFQLNVTVPFIRDRDY